MEKVTFFKNAVVKKLLRVCKKFVKTVFIRKKIYEQVFPGKIFVYYLPGTVFLPLQAGQYSWQ